MALTALERLRQYGATAAVAEEETRPLTALERLRQYQPAPPPVVTPPAAPVAAAPVEEGSGLMGNLQDRALGTGAAGLDIIANTAATANTQTPWDSIPGGTTAFNALETTAGVIGAAGEYLPEFLTDRAQAVQTNLAQQRAASPETQGPRSEFLQDFERQAREYSAGARAAQTPEEQAAQQGLGAATDSGVAGTIFYLWNNPRALGGVVDSLIPSIATGGAAGRLAGVATGARGAAVAAQLGVGASLEGAAAGQGAYDAVMSATPEDLSGSETFLALQEQLGSPDAAKSAMADIARTVASTTGTAASLLLAGVSQKLGANVVEDKLLDRVMAGATGSRAANMALGAGKEFLSEGAEGGAAQLAQNVGAVAGGAETDVTRGVAGSAFLEGLAGAGPGALAGAAQAPRRPVIQTGDPAFDAGAELAAVVTPEPSAPPPTPTPPAVTPKPRGAFGTQPAPARTADRSGAEAAAIVDNRLAALQEAAKAGRLSADEVKALDKERTELETIIREQDQAIKNNIVLAPANRLTKDERNFIDKRRLEIYSKIEKHRTAVSQGNELKKLQDRLNKVSDDNQFIRLSESLIPASNRLAPIAPERAPIVPIGEQVFPVADVMQPAAPIVDDADVLATEADLAGIDQQLASEQQRTFNAEARNRVVKELTTAKDKATAANLERMIGDGRINFYGDQATLPEGANSITDKGYFDGQRIYLNEAKLQEGEATSVALHEIKHYMDRLAEEGGQPIHRRSLRQFLGNEGNARVNTRINELASTGNVIAREAIEDARAGATREDGSFDQAVFDDEITPYFLQRVAAARDSQRPLGRALAVVKDIISAAKTKIADFGIDLNLSENDILYLGKQLVGAAANAQSGQGRAQNGRAMLVGKKAANYKQYLDQGIVFAGALDKLPRAEIDDSRTSIRPEGKELLSGRGSTFLGAVFNHPELYENYPALKRTRVRLLTPEELKPNPKLMGEADSAANTIAINPSLLGNDAELRRLLVHEGQHIIQEKEGFIPGAAASEFQTPQEVAAFAKADRDLSGFLANVDRDTLSSIKSKVTFRGEPPVSAGKILGAALDQDPMMRSFELEERAILQQYLDNLRVYTPLARKRTEAFEKYRRTGGEVESRAAEARIPLTQGERRSTPFSETSERMVGGVKAADLIDNTDPASGSRFAAQRAAQRQKVLSEKSAGRASRERPMNPQTETEAFKRWFGDSKVVDANGNPQVMYHGTSASEDGEAFSTFDSYGSNYGLFGQGSYFTDDPEVASSYVTKGRGKTPSVYPVYMSIQNPIDMDAQSHLGGMHAKWRGAFPEIDFQDEYKPVKTETTLPNGNVAKGATNEAYYRQVEEYFKDNEWIAYEAAETIQDGLRKMGFDGITHIGGGRVKSEGVRHKVFIAFEPDQIKSAISNNGDFDPKRADMRASRSRPEQPKRVTAKLAAAGIQQPLSRRAPVPTQARGVVAPSDKFVEEKTRIPATEGLLAKIKMAGDVALAAVAPSTKGKAADVREVMERTLGETTESKVRAAQALNALEKAVARTPKAKRNAVQRTLTATNSENKAVREAAIQTLKTSYPAVFAQYDSVRNQIRQWGLDAVVSIRDSGKQLTKKDVAIVSKILKNLDSYITRAYRIDYKGPIAEQQKKDTLGAWEKGDRTSRGAKAFEDARQYLVSTLRIGERGGMLKEGANLKNFTPQTLEQLEAIHAEWVSRDNFNTLPADATPEQQETYINTMLLDLENVRKSMTDAEYMKKLDDKALRLTKELIDTVNTGSSKLVQFFRGARQDNTIVSARADVPEAIRRLWGEITEPTAALAITLMRQGEFLARQKMLRELYDIGLGRYFVDQKDARSDTFTERLTGETFGPLEGMYATPRFKQEVESNIEPLNSWQKVLDALVSGKSDVATQAAAGLGIKYLSKAGSLNKKATVVYNPSSWVNNFLGGPATPIMQGMVPGKGLARGVKAAKDLIGPSFNERLSPEAQRVLKANLQESGQVGEIQEAQRNIIQNLLLEDGALSKANSLRKNFDDKAVDAYAMTDVVWKLSAFFATTDWLKSYYKAKGVTRTDEQIDREAAERVKARSITFSRAAPLVKFTEKLGVTAYAPYFYETYRTIGASLLGAAQDIRDGMAEGGKAGRMKTRLGMRSAAGATMALAYNRAILPAYQVAGGALLTGLVSLGAMQPADEEEEEKLAVIRKGMSDFYAGKELSLYRITEDGKYIFIEPGRVNPNDPATTPVAQLLTGDPETALEAITGLFFGNQGIAAVLSVGQEVLTDSKAKKPASAYQTPESYDQMVDILQNNLPISANKVAQTTRVFEKYIPKVLKTTLREATEDTGLTGADKFLAAMGQPFAVFDPKKDLRMSGFRDYADPLDKAKSDFKTVIETRNPSDEVIRDAYLRSLRMEHKAYTRMREVVEAAKMTGMKATSNSPSETTVESILRASPRLGGLGLTKMQTESLLQPEFRVTFITPVSTGNSKEKEITAAEKDATKIAAIEEKYRRIDSIIRSTTTEFKDLIASEETN